MWPGEAASNDGQCSPPTGSRRNKIMRPPTIESGGEILERRVRAQKGPGSSPAATVMQPPQASAFSRPTSGVESNQPWRRPSAISDHCFSRFVLANVKPQQGKQNSPEISTSNTKKNCSNNPRTSLLCIVLTTLVIFIAQDVSNLIANLTPNNQQTISSRSDIIVGRHWLATVGVQCANSSSSDQKTSTTVGQKISSLLQKHSSRDQLTNTNHSGSSSSNNINRAAGGAKIAPPKSTKSTSSAKSALLKAATANNSSAPGGGLATDRKPKLPTNALRRTTTNAHSTLTASQDPDDDRRSLPADGDEPSQISITPRVGQMRVPVDSNTMLKCLISSSASSSNASSNNRLSQKFHVHWSRFMFDENVYEHLDTEPLARAPPDEPEQVSSASSIRARHTSQQQQQVPFDRQGQLRDFLARSRQETNIISDLLIEATLSISPVKAADNASYFCTANDGRSMERQNQARIDLVALSRPIVQLERLFPARDSKSALIYWLVLSDGNTPIKKTIFMVRNDTSATAFSSRPLPPGLVQETQASNVDDADPESTRLSQYSSMVIDSNHHQWQRIEIPDERLDLEAAAQQSPSLLSPYEPPPRAGADVDVTSPLNSNSNQAQQQPDETQDYYGSRTRWNLLRANRRRQRSYNLSSLLPGITYNFRLAAINDMGQSEWSYLTATMPNEIPAQISEMYLLSRSNDSLAIGWRRPGYDGAKVVRFEMQLFDLNRTLTLDANTNTSSGSSSPTSHKTNFMYYFVNLNAGTDYHFHVRACSRAGCGAYSSPKLLASTLDGEADEPLEVELNCDPESGNVSVSWLPPANARGQLTNYSVSFDSRAQFRNQSGRWQVDEWRSSMETGDNQTLSLEAGAILLPNTNYSVRVCANNRSKRCGRLSQPSSRSQCSTAPELPSSMPANLRLKRVTHPSSGQLDQEATNREHLQLELPFISARNGTPSCIQVVLIRLPDSFRLGATKLSEILPEQPDFVTLSRFVADDSPTESGPLAYLAEELDPSSEWPPESDQQVTPIALGDGRHQQCKQRRSGHTPMARPEVFDGPLKAGASYTGFVKLILVRPASQSRSKYALGSETKRGNQSNQPEASQEILTKYSGYFEPIQMGDNVLEVANGSRLSNSDEITLSAPFAGVVDGLKTKPIQVVASEIGLSLRDNIGKFYHQSSSYVAKNLRLESVADFIKKSSPLIQLLEVGVIVIVISLLLLFFVYLITLPTVLARKRKRKIKRQLNKHQQDAAHEQLNNHPSQQQQQLQSNYMDKPEGFGGQIDSIPAAFAQQQDHIGRQQAANGTYHQPELEPQSYPAPISEQQHRLYAPANPKECPIHSSPASSGGRPAVHEHRQAAVHVCQPMPNYNHNHNHRRPDPQSDQYQPHHHHHHHIQADDGAAAAAARQQQYERNCRTTRRQHLQQAADLPGLAAKNCLTLSHQQQLNNSALALAKKINKSIPLRLFRAVLELRLRNGWLKEEFEQLPSALSLQEPNQKRAPLNGLAGTVIRLRPQLVVSRNDSMSALISGNDQYDAGRLTMMPTAPAAGNLAQSPSGGTTSGRQIICAKSPMDADSVWDFWRLVYEQEVSTIVMLTQNEDANTGELRCAQYWPTCDNEETTILSPCNEFVQKSTILPAKFKIRQETLDEETAQDGFMVRRLTLMVMATKPGENEQQQDGDSSQPDDNEHQQAKNGRPSSPADDDDEDEDGGDKYVIVQRDILQLQFHCWNTSTLANQLRLITFIRRSNERHLMSLKEQNLLERDAGQEQVSPQRSANNPMLVHCFNGLGRSGVFAGLSFVLDELTLKLQLERQDEQQLQRLNLFQLVSKMRGQREFILSPYRFYELLYQLTAHCVPQS